MAIMIMDNRNQEIYKINGKYLNLRLNGRFIFLRVFFDFERLFDLLGRFFRFLLKRNQKSQNH